MAAEQKVYVEFPATEFDSIEKFFAATFGWSFMDYGPEYRAFRAATFDGCFYQSSGKSRTDQGSALVVLFSDDLEATRDQVLANGGTLSKDIFPFPGGRRFQFLDPHGNELAVWSDK